MGLSDIFQSVNISFKEIVLSSVAPINSMRDLLLVLQPILILQNKPDFLSKLRSILFWFRNQSPILCHFNAIQAQFHVHLCLFLLSLFAIGIGLLSVNSGMCITGLYRPKPIVIQYE